MSFIRSIIYALTTRERLALIIAIVLLGTASVTKAVVLVRDNSTFVPVSGGVYREGIAGQPTAINPVISSNAADQDLAALVYGRLSDFLTDLSRDESGRVYVAKLTEGLTWDDGKPLTSDDVIFTLKLIQNPEVNSPLATTWQGVVVERISELQVKFTLPSAFAFFENNIHKLPIIPQHIFGVIPAANLRLSTYNLEPVSSGPYSFDGYSKRKDGFITEYRFVANDHFAGDAPYIQKMTVSFYEDTDALVQAFRSRKIDGFGMLTPPAEEVYSLPNAVVERVDMPRYYSVFFNPRATSLLQEQDFREALSYAVDRGALVADVLDSHATPISGPYYDSTHANGTSYQPDQAAETIAEYEEAGAATGVQLVVPDVSFVEDVAAFVADAWKAAGVEDVQIVSLQPEDFFNVVVRERNYEAVIFGNVLEHPLDLFPFWHSSERFYPGLNLAFYADDAVDTALENIRHTQDESERRTEFDRAVSFITEDAPAAFLFALPYTYVHDERLHGFNVSDDMIVVASDRFRMITDWYVNRARVIETESDMHATSTATSTTEQSTTTTP